MLRKIPQLVSTLLLAAIIAGSFSWAVASDRADRLFLFVIVALGNWIVLNGLINEFERNGLLRFKRAPPRDRAPTPAVVQDDPEHGKKPETPASGAQ
jgi:hypothetical protein